MKVLVLSSYSESLLNLRGNLLADMVRAGHEVIAAAPDEGGSVSRRLAERGVRFRPIALSRTGHNPLFDLSSVCDLNRLVRDERPDRCLSYNIKAVLYGSLVSNFRAVPGIFSIIAGVGYAFMGDSPRQRFTRALVSVPYKRAVASNHAVFFQNRDDIELFQRFGYLRNRNQAVLINGSGIDLDHFAPAAPMSDGPTFLFVGRLIKHKGLLEYVKAASYLKSKYPHARFRVVGPFDVNPTSISPQQLQEWEGQGAIEYLGTVEDIRPCIAEASVLTLPSYREGTPRSLLEGMSMCRPIVTTDAPGCRETVIDGFNGFFAKTGDVPSLAAAMEKFIVEPSLIETLGRNSRDLAVRKFDVRAVNKKIMETMSLL